MEGGRLHEAGRVKHCVCWGIAQCIRGVSYSYLCVFVIVYISDPLKETERDKGRKEGLGAFYNLPQYAKLYEVLKAAYSSYKVCLVMG